ARCSGPCSCSHAGPTVISEAQGMVPCSLSRLRSVKHDRYLRRCPMIKFSSQAFFSACRTPGRILLASKPPDKAHFEEAPLANPFAMIGRCDRADIIRNDNDVSWWHAYVQLLDGSAFIMDLGSESGVYVDGRPQGYGWIKPGHIFQIAKHWFQLEG